MISYTNSSKTPTNIRLPVLPPLTDEIEEEDSNQEGTDTSEEFKRPHIFEFLLLEAIGYVKDVNYNEDHH